jgi:predicted naringenin-chalcone synthase
VASDVGAKDAVFIEDIETVVPPYSYTQKEAAVLCERILAHDPEALEFTRRLLPGTGIDKRHSVIADYQRPPDQRVLLAPTPDFRPEPSTAARGKVFSVEAPALALQACRGLLARVPAAPRVTHLLTASCTGLEAPGFDVALVRELGLPLDVQRVHVGFMGCFAGFSTLKLAHAICQADPTARVLIVHVELCSLHVHFGPDRDELVASCLFADGISAALVSATPPRPGDGLRLRLGGATSWLVPDSEAEMGWRIGDDGFHMSLSARVPFLLRRHLPGVFGHLLDRHHLSRAQIRHWAIHPGGPAILAKACEALQLDDDQVRASREVLREYGNMSSATLWFLLDRVRRRTEPGWIFSCGFGPGLTVEAALLELTSGAPG